MKPFKRNLFLPPVALLLVCLVAYWPLSSFRFALKNDAFIFNFPNKSFFSESLRAGIIPLWNPYLNYGFPLYADPGFAWWQPITWIFGFIGYTPYTFTVEVLLYIFIAGLGMYWLGRVLNVQRTTAFAMACMFMCSGFFIGNLQHINFLTCAAFLPWLTGAWLNYQKKSSAVNLLWCSIAAYLLCTGGHPAIPIATAYFFLCLTILYFIIEKKTFSKAYIRHQFTLLLACALLLLPQLLSYWQVWPDYSRSVAVVQSQNLNVGFTLPSYISFFLPFSTIKNNGWFDTDVSMRNAYFSLLGILLFIQLLISGRKNSLQRIFFFSGAFMLLLAAGGTIKNVVYAILPGLNFIRTNGEFRVFAIFSFILCVSFPLNDLFSYQKVFLNVTKNWFKIIAMLCAVLTLVLLVGIKWNSLLNNTDASLPARIKFILDHFSFPQTLLIAAAVACLLAILYRFGLRKTPYLFLLVIIADLILNSWLLLPITGISQHSVVEMQAIIDKSPKGFLFPDWSNPTAIRPITPQQEQLIGNWNWYSKKVVYAEPISYPSMLKSTEAFLHSPDTNVIKSKPFIFLKNNKGTLQLTRFTPNQINLNILLRERDTLILLQNNYLGWRAWINETPADIQPYLKTFMQLPLDESAKHISFQFSLF